MKEMIKKSDLLKAIARIQPSAENYGSSEDSDRNASVEDSAYWAARDMFDDIMFQIQAVTDAETEYVPVVHGKWKLILIGGMPIVQCSACNGNKTHTSDFCPHCGAKMDEEDK